MQPTLQVVISRVYVYNTVVTRTCSVVQVTTDTTMVENLPYYFRVTTYPIGHQ